MSEDAAADGLIRQMVRESEQRSEDLSTLIQRFENAGLLNKVTVHKYLCRRGCLRGRVMNIGGRLVMRTRDYKLAPGANQAQSVASARARNTIDGNRHWPGHDFDVAELASWGDVAAIGLNCRHGLHNELAVNILAKCEGVSPGHPGAPTLL